ncbi:class I SAM-dependent methyltransferase [Candidatus Auribacterota bacterium]
MERFSDSFLSVNSEYLSDYAKKWVIDPLHQWSRQWEYPYVFDGISKSISNTGNRRLEILDAGSGITFFPYFIKSQFGTAGVTCCDFDSALDKTFSDTNKNTGCNIGFVHSDLRKTPFNDSFFDIIYCISVLEHTEGYKAIIDEFSRIIKPGGKLIITFDISIDGSDNLSPEESEEFMRVLSGGFTFDKRADISSRDQLSRPDILTTAHFAKTGRKLIPWLHPSLRRRIKSIITGKRIPSWPPPYTVYAVNLTNCLK